MAKKRTEKKTKTFSEAIGLQYIFNNTITDFFIGLALVVIAVVIIIAMISFLNTGANDQSLLENLKPGEWTNTEKQFQNYCGSWGAIVSYWLQFRISSLHAPILCHYGGIADDACLQAEPVEMVLLHDCGHAMDVGNLCQVHRTYHAKPHLQSGRKARTLCRAESGEHHGSSRAYCHSFLRGGSIPHLSHH